MGFATYAPFTNLQRPLEATVQTQPILLMPDHLEVLELSPATTTRELTLQAQRALHLEVLEVEPEVAAPAPATTTTTTLAEAPPNELEVEVVAPVIGPTGESRERQRREQHILQIVS